MVRHRPVTPNDAGPNPAPLVLLMMCLLIPWPSLPRREMVSNWELGLQLKTGDRTTMIKKSGSTYKVVSEKGKNLGSGYKSKAAAAKRLRQVEFFKHAKKG